MKSFKYLNISPTKIAHSLGIEAGNPPQNCQVILV